jgi:glycosyltransferase involved in cell wall biosynthesis
MDVRNPRILYISYDGMTDPLGQSQVIPYLRSLTAAGYRFTILSVEKKKRFERTGEYIASILKEIGIEWKTLLFTSQPPIISKLIDQRKLNRAAMELHKKENFDLIHCRSYVAAAAGKRVSKKFGVPFLFDMRGFWVDERVDSGLWNLSNPLYKYFYKIYKKKEQSYFNTSSHIISLTEKGRAELRDHYTVPADKITVIPCCADLMHFDYSKVSEEDKARLRERFNISTGQKLISYLGSLGGWYMTDEMLDFFSVMRAKISGARFLLITHDNKENILQKAAAKGIPAEDLIIAPASRNEVPAFLSISDWNIFFIKDLYSKRASSPTKQGEVMGMGIPILCNDIGDTGEIIKESGAGIVVEKFNEKEYSRICELLPSLLQIKKEDIRRAAFEYYDLDKGVSKYREVYQRLIQK